MSLSAKPAIRNTPQPRWSARPITRVDKLGRVAFEHLKVLPPAIEGSPGLLFTFQGRTTHEIGQLALVERGVIPVPRVREADRFGRLAGGLGDVDTAR